MIRYSILIALAAIFLYSCEERENILEDLNEPPELRFYSKDNTLLDSDFYSDSIKLAKGNTSEYLVKLHVKDDFNNWQIEHSSTNGAFAKSSLNDSTLLLSYFPNGEGYHDITITVLDNLGKKKELRLSLFAFQNLVPMAKLSITENLEGDFIFDGSSSYDTDERFGGQVSKYKFTIEGEELTLTKDNMKFYVDRKGVYEVTLAVVDNDNAVSETVTSELIID